MSASPTDMQTKLEQDARIRTSQGGIRVTMTLGTHLRSKVYRICFISTINNADGCVLNIAFDEFNRVTSDEVPLTELITLLCGLPLTEHFKVEHGSYDKAPPAYTLSLKSCIEDQKVIALAMLERLLSLKAEKKVREEDQLSEEQKLINDFVTDMRKTSYFLGTYDKSSMTRRLNHYHPTLSYDDFFVTYKAFGGTKTIDDFENQAAPEEPLTVISSQSSFFAPQSSTILSDETSIPSGFSEFSESGVSSELDERNESSESGEPSLPGESGEPGEASLPNEPGKPSSQDNKPSGGGCCSIA